MADWGFSQFELQRLQGNSYVLCDHAIVYMDTPKAANSSFKLALAALAGVDLSGLPKSLSPATIEELAVHDRSCVDMPSLLDITDERREALLGSADVLRFCVVRNPYARLASAWIDRVLCHSLAPIQPLLRHLEFPDYIPEWSYLQARFAEFVDHLYRVEGDEFTNHHWQRQSELLLPDIMNYNQIVQLEHLQTGLDIIIAHVEKSGHTWPGLPRINESPLPYSARLYTAATRRKVYELFADDFNAYGYRPGDLPPGSRVELPDSGIIHAIQKRNRRIFHLSLTARGLL